MSRLTNDLALYFVVFQLLSFIYLGNVTDDFNDVIDEMANGSEKYNLKDLKAICHAKLLHRLDNLAEIVGFFSILLVEIGYFLPKNRSEFLAHRPTMTME